MKLINLFLIAAALTLGACGTELETETQTTQDQQVKVENAEVPKTIVLVENVETKEVKAYELEGDFENFDAENLTETQKYELAQKVGTNQIQTTPENEGFKINMDDDFDLPTKDTVNYYYRGYYRRGFYGYRYGYRFPYRYGYGYRYGGYRYGYYRPYYGYGYGYRYGYRYGYYW